MNVCMYVCLWVHVYVCIYVCGIKPKEKYVRISAKELWRNLDCPPKNKELWSYVVKFEFSRPKRSSVKEFVLRKHI